MNFQYLFVFWEQNRGRVVQYYAPTNLFLYFWGFYVCANFGANRSRNAIMRVCMDGQIHRHTDANWFYNLSHATCYSYEADKTISKYLQTSSK